MVSVRPFSAKNEIFAVLGLARNPSKRLRLDESFRMVTSACQCITTIKSYGQITEIILCMFMSNVGPDVRRPDVIYDPLKIIPCYTFLRKWLKPPVAAATEACVGFAQALRRLRGSPVWTPKFRGGSAQALLRLRASKICQARSVAQTAGNLAKSRSCVDLLRLRSGW